PAIAALATVIPPAIAALATVIQPAIAALASVTATLVAALAAIIATLVAALLATVTPVATLSVHGATRRRMPRTAVRSPGTSPVRPCIAVSAVRPRTPFALVVISPIVPTPVGASAVAVVAVLSHLDRPSLRLAIRF